jgi:hypothetical protein
MSENSIQNYLPYSVLGSEAKFKALIDMKTLQSILESTALKSTGLKKRITKVEYLKILTQPMLNICEEFDDYTKQ